MKRIVLATICILIATVSMGNVHAMPSMPSPFFTGTSKQAVFLSPLDNWMPTYRLERYVTLLQQAGYQVDVLLDGNVTISFLKTGLAKYDLIILRTDSYTSEGIDYYCSGEPATPNARGTYAQEIAAHEISAAGVCVGFSTLFVKDNYPPGSLHGLVYAVSGATEELSSPFIAAGASVFIGYGDDMTGLYWGRMDALATKMFEYLSQGSTVKGAVIELYGYLTYGHGQTATLPSIEWYGDGDYKI